MKHSARRMLLWRDSGTLPACLPCTPGLGTCPIDKVALSVCARCILVELLELALSTALALSTKLAL